MAWFKKEKTPLAPPEKKVLVPEGLWTKCKGCSETLYRKEVIRNLNVCPKCNYHFGLTSAERVSMLLDGGVYEVLDENLYSNDPLQFQDTKRYRDRLRKSKESSGLTDAIFSVRGTMDGELKHVH